MMRHHPDIVPRDETRNPATGQGGRANRKGNINSSENNDPSGIEQAETALGAALREALARRAVAQ
jgi:hypothetical protein